MATCCIEDGFDEDAVQISGHRPAEDGAGAPGGHRQG